MYKIPSNVCLIIIILFTINICLILLMEVVVDIIPPILIILKILCKELNWVELSGFKID